MMTGTSATITAVATGPQGAISVIRISGSEAILICDAVFTPASGKPLSSAKGYTLHYGTINGPDGSQIDDVIVSLFRAPRSYTGEDMVEISCHGSQYIRREIINLLIARGARYAEAGEFTIRAFLNGKIDLSQAEAVADMIASRDKASHALAMNQMRGGYSSLFSTLRDKLIELVSLIELELDFGEEDVEFADRTRLTATIDDIQQRIGVLKQSFSLGNAIKEGVPVAIAGSPNVGKSTLLNRLLGENRAMVSDIAGTTRDIIEESIVIDGITFRFIDTAGIRETNDVLERMGIERTHSSISRARIVLLLVDATKNMSKTIENSLSDIQLTDAQTLAVIMNKSDLSDTEAPAGLPYPIIRISARTGAGLDALRDFLSDSIHSDPSYTGDAIVSNMRHYEALHNASDALDRARTGMDNNLPADLLAQDIREAIHHIGTVTGEISTDDVLGSIFSKFCIGK